MRIVCYNLCYGQGLSGKTSDYLQFWKFFQTKKHMAAIEQWILEQDPDIIGLVEIDTGSFIRGDQTLFFRNVFDYQFFDTKYTGSLLKLPILKKQANGVVSKHKCTYKKHYLSKGMKRLVIEMNIQAPKPLSVFLVHLALQKKTREQQLQELSTIIPKKGAIIIGDFNTTPETLSTFFEQIAYKPKDHQPTFPRYNPKKCIDYILHTSDIIIKQFQTCDVAFSDHLALVADIAFVHD
ncbi:MAG: endonuclease/exonuclease/phosphatase family protein [Candidatus Woesearchaeota archaeon]